MLAIEVRYSFESNIYYYEMGGNERIVFCGFILVIEKKFLRGILIRVG